MKKVLFLLTALGLLFAGCEKESEYDEISTMIIASKKLEGIAFSCGMNIKLKRSSCCERSEQFEDRVVRSAIYLWGLPPF